MFGAKLIINTFNVRIVVHVIIPLKSINHEKLNVTWIVLTLMISEKPK